MLMGRMTVMLMGRVRNQMSAELLELRPGARQIEPSATGGALQPIWNQSLNIHWHCNLLQQHTQAKYGRKVAGTGAICDRAIDMHRTIYTCVCVWPLDRGPVCPDQHCISNSAFPEATGWPQNMQDSTGTSGDAGMLRHVKLVLSVALMCVSCVELRRVHEPH